MKYILGSNAVWWPVIVNRPDPENPGQVTPQKLKVQFPPIEQDDFLANQERILAITGPRARAKAERDYFATLVLDWADVEDDFGHRVPCTDEAKAAALQDGAFRGAIWTAMGELMRGEPARLGN